MLPIVLMQTAPAPATPPANGVRLLLTLKGAPPVGHRGWEPGMTLAGRAAQIREVSARRGDVVRALKPFGFREKLGRSWFRPLDNRCRQRRSRSCQVPPDDAS